MYGGLHMDELIVIYLNDQVFNATIVALYSIMLVIERHDFHMVSRHLVVSIVHL